jgi:uncharacterized protein with FMN-binding domain
MKRVIFAVTSTVVGLVALLSFKSQNHVTVGGGLPSASISGGSSTTGAAANPSSAAGSRSSASTPSPTASASPAAPKTSTSAPKTYDGTAIQTRYGTVQVQITVAAGKITNAAFLQLTSDDGRSAEINSQAGPMLLQETLSAQSSSIDTISGATFTSEGYLQSLQSALDQAGLK